MQSQKPTCPPRISPVIRRLFALAMTACLLAVRCSAARPAGSEFPDYANAFRMERLRATACGPISLLAILNRMDVPLSQADIKAILATADSKGTNLLQLKQLAERYGLHALGADLTTARLRQCGLYAIAHLNGSRFVAITGYSKNAVQMVEPLKRPVLVRDEEFNRAFTGRALLLAKRPIPSAIFAAVRRQSPDAALQLSQTSLAVGAINSPGWQKSLTIRNTSPERVNIRKVQSSCSCMSGSLDRTTLPPGSSAILTVNGTEDQVGSFNRTITLITDSKHSPLLKIPVQGYLEPPVFLETPAVTLTDVLTGQTATAEIPLILSASLQPEDLTVQLPEGAPLSAQIHRTNDGRLRLLLSFDGASEPGWRRFTIGIGPKDSPPQGQTPLHLAVHVLPLVEVFPPSLTIPESPSMRPWSRRLTFKFNAILAEEVQYEWSDKAFSDAIDIRLNTDNDNTLSAVLSEKPVGSFKTVLGLQADLIFRFASDAECAVRIYAGQRAFATNPDRDQTERRWSP